MSASFVFCVTLSAPVFPYIGALEKFDPVHNRSRLSAWISPDEEYLRSIVWDILGMAIPLSTQGIIILSTIMMAHALTQSQRFRSANYQSYVVTKTKARETTKSDFYSNTNSGKLTGKERQIVKQVVVISLCYIFSNTPKILFLLTGMIVPGFSLNGHLGTVYVVVSCIRTVFEMIYPAISLPIYYTYNTKFREIVFRS